MSDRARELLARAGLIIAQYRWSDPEDQGLRELSEQINEYFEDTAQESKPIAYWDTQEGKLIPAVPLSSERTCFKVPLVPLYLHPRADIVDELVEAVNDVLNRLDIAFPDMPNYPPIIKARAALKKLEEE